MYYSLSLILEKSSLAETNYIFYEVKKKRRYHSILLHEKEKCGCENTLYLTTVEDYLLWTREEIFNYPESSGLILADPNRIWEPQLMQYRNHLLDLKSDLLIVRKESLVSCFNQLAASLHTLNHRMETFSRAVIDGRKLEEIILLFYDYLGNPAYIVDSSFKVLAIDRRNNMRELSANWRQMEDQGYLSYDIVSKIISNNELSDMESGAKVQWVTSAHFYTPFINYNLRRKKKLFGHLFLINMFHQITRGDMELFSCMGDLIEKAMKSDQKYQTQRGRLYEYFLSDIMSGKMTDPKEINKQMQSLTYPPNSYYLLTLLSPPQDSLNEITEERLFQQLEQLKGCKPIHFEDKVAALLPLRDSERKELLLKQIQYIVENFHLRAGVSETFYGYDPIHTCTQQAAIAWDIGRASGESITCFDQCAVRYLQEKILVPQDMQILEPSGLRRLRTYDQQNHTEYGETLLSYLVHERNVVETAQALFIHRNTLTYRINKIHEIARLNLDDPVIRWRILTVSLGKGLGKPELICY